jgi:hypothetical protein
MFRILVHGGLTAALTLSAAVAVTATPAAAAARSFANCTALNGTYRHGVARSGARDKVRGSTKPVTNFKVSTALYNANKRMDRDGDGVACEKR